MLNKITKNKFLIFVWSISALSFSIHAFIDYKLNVLTQTISTSFVLLAVCIPIFYSLSHKRETTGTNILKKEKRLNIYKLATLSGLTFAILFISTYGISFAPIWSEEIYWIEDAKKIISGELINPMGIKGDNPANFQAWTCALILLLTSNPILSARLPSVFYSILTSIFSLLIIRRISNCKDFIYCSPVIFFSAPLFYYSQIGFSEITIVPALISFCLYRFIEFIADEKNKERNLGLLAIASGLCFWTLYTPIIVGGCVIFLSLLQPNLILSKKLKVVLFSFVILACSPTIGKIVNNPNLYIGRHISLIKGGEWGRNFNQKRTPLAAYVENINSLAKNISPFQNRSLLETRFNITIEYSTLFFALVGFALLLKLKRNNLLFLNCFLAQLISLILSNQTLSPWRELCLVPFIIVFAGLGFSSIFSFIKKYSFFGSCVFFSMVSSVHVYIFFFSLIGYVHPGRNWTPGLLAQTLNFEKLPDNKILIFDDYGGWLERSLNAIAPTGVEIKSTKSEEQLLNSKDLVCLFQPFENLVNFEFLSLIHARKNLVYENRSYSQDKYVKCYRPKLNLPQID